MGGLTAVGNLPLPSVEQLSRVGVPALQLTNSGKNLRSYLDVLMFGAGLNIIDQVNDCEADGDFTESDNGTFDIASAAATGKRVGTNCMKLSSTAACDGTQYVQSLLIDKSVQPSPNPANGRNQMDWRDTRYVGFWVHNTSNGDFSTAGEAKFTIVNNGVEQTQKNVQALVDDVHQWCEIDISAYDRDAVESIRFYANVGIGEDIFIDDIIRYQISYVGGPYYGCMFPIASGTTLTEGDICNWSVDGLVVGSAAVTTLGPVKLFQNGEPVAAGGTAVGTGKREHWGVIPGVRMYIQEANATTIAGEGVEYQTATRVEGVATGVDEFGFGKCLEAAGAQYDDIFVVNTFGGNFIS